MRAEVVVLQPAFIDDSTPISTNYLSYDKGPRRCNSWFYTQLRLSLDCYGGIDRTRE